MSAPFERAAAPASTRRTLRRMLGAAAHELPLALWGLRPAPPGRARPWVRVRNRRERLVAAPHGPGVRCDWRWTSELHVARVFPRVGLWLMRRALRDHPITLALEPRAMAGTPQVTFVIGHRGQARLPHLLATLASVAGQRDVACECVVVEQSEAPEAQAWLPAWVRYVHTPLPRAGLPYNRSWALNVGAVRARGALLVLHDNDMLVPHDYAAALWRGFEAGDEVLNLKRFIFYWAQGASQRLLEHRALALDAPPESIVQNLEAGGSVAVSARAFDALGGFDEAFVGWGGEDNEFWERAQTRAVCSFGHLPLVHLWHAPQPGKGLGLAQPSVARYQELSRVPVQERIAALRRRARGRIEGAAPLTG